MMLRSTMALACAAIACGLSACASQPDINRDQNEIRQVLDTYLESVKKADLTLASNVWVQRPDVVVVMPLGRFQG